MLALCFFNVAQAAPTYQAQGAASSGTGGVTPAWPAHAVGDVALLIVETANQAVTLSSNTAGFVQVANSPQGTGTAGGTTSSRLTVFWARATSTNMANPTVADSGDHQTAQIVTFRGVIGTGNPWDATAGNVASTASNSFAIPGGTTSVPDTLVVAIIAAGIDSNTDTQRAGWTNGSLTSLTERIDSNTNAGNGGGFGVATGVMATAGTYSSTTGTLAANSVQGRISLALKPKTTTLLGDGANPANVTIAPSAAITDLDSFTLVNNFGSDSVTALTVTLTGTNSFESLSEVRITSNDGGTTYFSAVTNPASNTISFSGGASIPVTTTTTSFKVRITPKTHANMPAPPGFLYSVGGTVTAFTNPNLQTGSDPASATVTIDNESPASATAASVSAGDMQATLNWTTSVSSDFSRSVVLRWTGSSVGADVPAEGVDYTNGTTIGGATVVCVRTADAASAAVSGVDGMGSGGCSATALSNGTVYAYKVFQKDSRGNYDVGVAIGTITPRGAVSPTVSTVVASPASVPADNFTNATITVTLKDGTGIPVPGKVVALTAGSGSSVITTVSGTTNASGVATFTVKNVTVQGPISYTATDTSDSIVITQTAQVTFTTPSLCFTDDFNRADLLSTGYWTKTKGVGTNYNAGIVNSRLRLTDATVVSGGEATAVHLNRLFPGAGNKVVAEFDYYAYGGTGGDGTVITLSDSSIAPVAGAFGGSLGYAQKSNPGSDCTVTGGCPGFAGGWIGVGVDEFGNYSNPTEGRVGGPGVLANSVTVRGSGSGQNGYNWHKTAAVGSGITTTSTTWHRYRVTVDHSDGLHAYTSVDRDTTGSGNSYTNLISVYDAKAILTQAAVPPYWFFSLTASTGGSSNIHEIDNLNVCTAQPIVTPSLDHMRIVHDGSALTCAPEMITLKACATADCSALFTGSVTVNLDTISGATWSSNPVTFSGGQAQVTLTKTTTGTVILGGSVTAPNSMSAVCYNGSSSGSCSLTYSANACAFDAVESGQAPSTPIFTKLAGVNFTVDVLALNAGAINTSFNSAVTVDLVDQSGTAAGSCGSTSLTCTVTPTSPYTFTRGTGLDNGRKTFTFNCPNAARDMRVRMVSGASSACSSDNFAIRPPSFTVTSPNANNSANIGTPIIKTGAAFELDAASVNSYTGTALINSNRIVAHSGAVQTGALSGTFSAATSATGWVSKGTAFTYSEVGSFQFSPWGVYDDGSFAAVDRGKATPECVIDSKIGTNVDPGDPNVKDGNGKYGCYFGGTNIAGSTITSPYFGRFIPDHFNTAVTLTAEVPMACPAGLTCPVSYNGFVYSGQPFALNVSAMNSSDVQTQNYQGNFSKAVALSAINAVGGTEIATAAPGGTLTAVAVPAVSFSSGGTAAPGTPASPVFTFATTPTAPTDVYVRALDTDGVTSLRSVAASSVEGGVKVVNGRGMVPNAYGSELLRLPINGVEVQYYNGTRWENSSTDTTLLEVGNVSLSSCSGNLGNPAPDCKIAPIMGVNSRTQFAMVSGERVGSITLNAPGAGNDGSVDVSLNGGGWPAWLPSTTGRATFGIYKGNSKFIYIRELY
jgi:MSHA biogenesis protein MshQ